MPNAAVIRCFADIAVREDIASRYPWPVVANYQDILDAIASQNAVAAAWRVRDSWESLIRFLAILSIASSPKVSDSEQQRKVAARLFKEGGFSMGDLVEIISLLGNVRGNYGLQPYFTALTRSRARGSLLHLLNGGDHSESFVPWRNRRFGHGVFGRSESDFAEEAKLFLKKLHQALQLCDSLLSQVLVESDCGEHTVEWSGKDPCTSYSEQRTAPVNQWVPARIRLRSTQTLIGLSPHLTIQSCKNCGHLAVFSIDRCERKHTRAWFLDLYGGHRHSISRVESLAELAALPPPSPARQPDTSRTAPHDFLDADRFVTFGTFVPPAYLARLLANDISRRDKALFILTGDAGSGKTWLCHGLSHFSMLPEYLHANIPVLEVACASCATTRDDGAAFLQLLWLAASKLESAMNWVVPDSPTTDPSKGLIAFITDLMAQNSIGKLILAIDGLDELKADSDVPTIIPSSADLPPGLYLILTTRPSPRANAIQRLASISEGAIPIQIEGMGVDHQTLIRTYVTRTLNTERKDLLPALLPREWASHIIELAAGSFLFAAHYCNALRWGVFPDARSLPPPDSFYPRFFDQVRKRVGDKIFATIYKPIIARIVAFNAPRVDLYQPSLVSVDQIGFAPSWVLDVIGDVGGLLTVHRDPNRPEPQYSIAHELIARYLLNDNLWGDEVRLARTSIATDICDRIINDPSDIINLPVNELSYLCQCATDPVDVDPTLSTRLFNEPLVLEELLKLSDIKRWSSDNAGRHANSAAETQDIIASSRARMAIAGVLFLCVHDVFAIKLSKYPHEYHDNEFLRRLKTTTDQTHWSTIASAMLIFEPAQVEMKMLVAMLQALHASRELKAERYNSALLYYDHAIALLERTLAEVQVGLQQVGLPLPANRRSVWRRIRELVARPDRTAGEQFGTLGVDNRRRIQKLLSELRLTSVPALLQASDASPIRRAHAATSALLNSHLGEHRDSLPAYAGFQLQCIDQLSGEEDIIHAAELATRAVSAIAQVAGTASTISGRIREITNHVDKLNRELDLDPKGSGACAARVWAFKQALREVCG